MSKLTVAIDAGPLHDARATAGMGRYVAGLLEALQQRDDVRMLVARPPWRPRPDAWAVRWMNAQPWLLGRAVAGRARLLHCTGSDPALAWPLARQVVTLHDVEPWMTGWQRRGPSERWFAYERGRFARCAAVIAPSRATADDAARVLAVPAERLHVVPEGVGAPFSTSPGSDDAARRGRAGTPGGRYVLWTGSLAQWDRRKGLDVLLEAMATLEGSAVLVCAGRRGLGSERLRELAGTRVPIHLCGFVEDATLAALYRGAAAVVVPSRSEGFGLPLLEAMACGVPAVSSDGGNLRDLAADAALVVPAGNATALAVALRTVLDDDVVAERLRRAGPERAAAFSWSRAAEGTVRAYRSAIAGPAPSWR